MTGLSFDERVKASERRKRIQHDVDKQREAMYMRALAQALVENRKRLAEYALRGKPLKSEQHKHL
jgi:hypothetical protein